MNGKNVEYCRTLLQMCTLLLFVSWRLDPSSSEIFSLPDTWRSRLNFGLADCEKDGIQNCPKLEFSGPGFGQVLGGAVIWNQVCLQPKPGKQAELSEAKKVQEMEAASG
jgi:hypothetical protein